ncbi:MAG: right-handed parallel beta-helix repeat-containing protein [Planctomycetota bacterium]
MRPIVYLLVLLAIGASVRAAAAGQILIAPGDQWSKQAQQMRAGDELILMPGRHRPGKLAELVGTADRPIIIRGLSTEKPAIIAADRDGILLRDVRHIVIKDLFIEGARINGISVRTSGDPDAPPVPTNITIRGVHIRHTGPTGRRHGIQIERADGVRIRECTLEGWGGSGIDIVSCTDVRVDGCRFLSAPNHGQDAAMSFRGRTEDIEILRCSVEDAGTWGIVLGGPRDATLDDVGGATDPDAVREHSVRDIMISSTLIRGTACPIHFRSVRDCTVRSVTFALPREYLLAVDLVDETEKIAPSTDLRFTRNLVLWQDGTLKNLAVRGKIADPDAIGVGENLWWTTSGPADLDSVGGLPGVETFPQRTTLDPKLDDRFRASVSEARVFGVTR